MAPPRLVLRFALYAGAALLVAVAVGLALTRRNASVPRRGARARRGARYGVTGGAARSDVPVRWSFDPAHYLPRTPATAMSQSA